jgi:hypothetical protein
VYKFRLGLSSITYVMPLYQLSTHVGRHLWDLMYMCKSFADCAHKAAFTRANMFDEHVRAFAGVHALVKAMSNMFVEHVCPCKGRLKATSNMFDEHIRSFKHVENFRVFDDLTRLTNAHE